MSILQCKSIADVTLIKCLKLTSPVLGQIKNAHCLIGYKEKNTLLLWHSCQNASVKLKTLQIQNSTALNWKEKNDSQSSEPQCTLLLGRIKLTDKKRIMKYKSVKYKNSGIGYS